MVPVSSCSPSRLSPSWSADGRRQHGLSEWRRGLRGRRAACEARQAWQERGERFHGGGGATSVAYSAVTGGCVEAQASAKRRGRERAAAGE